MLRSAVLVGWAIHSTFLIQLALNLSPMHRSTAVSFILSGFALLGIVTNKPRLTLIGSGVTATLAAVSLVEILLGAPLGVAPATAICFLVLSTGFVLTETSWL